MGEYFAELWQYYAMDGNWEQLFFVMAPAARAGHSAVWDDDKGTMLVFAGENGIGLDDLMKCDLHNKAWSVASSGPSPRSQHSAVWDGVTRSMIILGGWSGSRYLHDLHIYDVSADAWREPLPSLEHGRAGHAAAWLPHLMFMLVFAGVQNVSGNLSYSAQLHRSLDQTKRENRFSCGTLAPQQNSLQGYRPEVTLRLAGLTCSQPLGLT